MSKALHIALAVLPASLVVTGCTPKPDNSERIREYQRCVAGGMEARTNLNGDILCMPPKMLP